jgi:hypothetical protein
MNEVLEEILTAADLAPGEHRVRIDDIAGGGRLYFKEFRKPFVMDQKTFHALAKDFGEGNSARWSGREVILSVSGANIAIRSLINPRPPAITPKPSVAAELADLLARAITAPGDRTAMIHTLRQAADLLAAHH